MSHSEGRMLSLNKLKVLDWSLLCLSVIGAVLLIVSAFAGSSRPFFALGLIFTGCSGIVNGIRILRKNKKESR